MCRKTSERTAAAHNPAVRLALMLFASLAHNLHFCKAGWWRTHSSLHQGPLTEDCGGMSSYTQTWEGNLEQLHWTVTAQSWDTFSCRVSRVMWSAGIFKAVTATLLIFRLLSPLRLNGTQVDPKWQTVSSGAWYYQSFRGSCSSCYITQLLIPFRRDGIRYRGAVTNIISLGKMKSDKGLWWFLVFWKEELTPVWFTKERDFH